MTKNQVQKMEDAPQIVNPYAVASAAGKPEGPGSAVAQSDAHRAMIEVMTSFEVAKRFPRDMTQVANKILKECERPTLAELAVYSFPKGGQTITGPTIRLLEAIARAHGNMRFGWECLESTKQKSSIRAFAIDLENNTLRDTRFDVRHWRDTKQGGYAITDERDIYELQANMAMRRVRGCLQGLIAGDVIEMALEQCELTSRQNIDSSPEGIKKMVAAFSAFGVNAAMIEAKNGGLKVEAMRAPQIIVLRKIYAGLRDGIGKVEDYFDIELADKKGVKKKGPDLKAEVDKKKAEKSPKMVEKTNVIIDEDASGVNEIDDENQDDGNDVSRETTKDPNAPLTTIERIVKACEDALDGIQIQEVWEKFAADIGAIKRNNKEGYATIMDAKVAAEKRVAGTEA